MKSPQQVLTDVQRRLTRTWADDVAGAGEPGWPHAFPIGRASSTELAAGVDATFALALDWRDWATGHGLCLQVTDRRVLGTSQELPTHLVVPDLDAAAALVGGDWPARLARARLRAEVLRERYAHLAQPEKMLAQVDGFTDVDFDLLCRAADWFATHDASGLTPRQVPIEGLHAKWLNTRQHLVRELAGVADLRLLPPHPARLHFTYLDPTYRAGGGRVHDSATVGDRVGLPYPPRVVLISENKDTAIHFPSVVGGVAVEGVGRGGGTAAAFEWITDAPAVFYWGDMDADGLEILNEFRAAGIPARSLLMDQHAYAAWERFGSTVDARGRDLEPRVARPVPHLTEAESALYHQLIDVGWDRPRRIEQERIPLTAALAELQRRLMA